MSDTANLGLPCIEGSQAQKHVTHNDALRILDTLVQLAVLDRDLTAPPASPSDGQRWIVKTGASGAWSGHDDAIAAWQDGGWQFSAPQTGWLAYAADEGVLLVWDGSAWTAAVEAINALNNLTLLGLGTTADAGNPLSVKLNDALFTARTAAEGGDGDLRCKLSKEAAGNTLSLLFQDNFSGRAEIGLAGDDNFHLKVSPDGSSWNDAMVIDADAGAVGVGNTDPAGLNISGLSPPPTLQVAGSATAGSFGVIRYNGGGGGGAPVTLLSSRGASALDYAAAIDGDGMGGFLFGASDGTRYIMGANILAAVDGAVSTDNVRGRLVFATSPGGANYRVERMRITSDGKVAIGSSGSPNDTLDVDGNVVPHADNAYSCGAASYRWSAVYAATGTINTSDARQKTDIAPSDLGLDFILALKPSRYRWAEGGLVVKTNIVDEEVEEQVTEPVERVVEGIEMIDGRAVWRKKTVTVEQAVFDDLPVVDDAGRPVLDKADPKPGEVAASARPPVPRQRRYAVPRMHKVKRPRAITTTVPRAGKRQHYGLIAQDVKEALTAAGVADFAGWILTDSNDPQSTQGLRYDQFIAPLIKAVQEQQRMIETLREQIASASGSRS